MSNLAQDILFGVIESVRINYQNEPYILTGFGS